MSMSATEKVPANPLEDRDVSIGLPRHLAEGLVRKKLRIPRGKWHALDAIGQPGLLQCPTHTLLHLSFEGEVARSAGEG